VGLENSFFLSPQASSMDPFLFFCFWLISL
jgi:hypothetical protein